MRIGLLLVMALACTRATAHAGEQFAGFLTFGCGDHFIKIPDVPETWSVNLSASQWQEMSRLSGYTKSEYVTWTTLHVELLGEIRTAPKSGYFGVHSKQLDVERVISARYTEFAESLGAATAPAKLFKGYLLAGPESVGFVPSEQSDEFWWVVPGKVGWDKIIDEHFRPRPDLTNKHFYNALVEITGRVGPPGSYGHQGDFNREIAVDEFKFIRSVEPQEMAGTAAIYGEVEIAINSCKPQTRRWMDETRVVSDGLLTSPHAASRRRRGGRW